MRMGTKVLGSCGSVMSLSLIHLVKRMLKAGKLSSPIPNVPWLLSGLGSSSASLIFFLAPRQLFMGGWSTQDLLFHYEIG